MDVDEHVKQKAEATTQGTEDTQTLTDETSSAIPKTTSNADQDPKGAAAATVDSNERDIKAAAASALAAAAVKAKVGSLDADRQSYVILFFSSISRRSKNGRLNRPWHKWWKCKSRSWKSNCDISKSSKQLWIANAKCSKFNGSNFFKNGNNFSWNKSKHPN